MSDVLASRWEQQVRREIAPLARLPPPALVEPVRELLALAPAALGEPGLAVPELVAAHAESRTRAGIGADAVAGEYACMRDVLVDAAFAFAPPAALHDAVRALRRVIDRWANAALAACLRDADAARERLVAILAHDLRTPLSCIAMAAELLAGSRSSDAHADGLHVQILAAAERMERMVSDMLELARRQLGHELPIAPRPDDLGAICRSVVDEVAIANPGRAIALDASGDLRGQFDRDRVAQAISNLVRNAIEHGIGTVNVRAAREPERGALVVDVTNMRAAEASGRLPVLTSRADGRLGFGLYIVHKIAQAHGAICTNESSSVKTTYTLRWPLPPA